MGVVEDSRREAEWIASHHDSSLHVVVPATGVRRDAERRDSPEGMTRDADVVGIHHAGERTIVTVRGFTSR